MGLFLTIKHKRIILTTMEVDQYDYIICNPGEGFPVIPHLQVVVKTLNGAYRTCRDTPGGGPPYGGPPADAGHLVMGIHVVVQMVIETPLYKS